MIRGAVTPPPYIPDWLEELPVWDESLTAQIGVYIGTIRGLENPIVRIENNKISLIVGMRSSEGMYHYWGVDDEDGIYIGSEPDAWSNIATDIITESGYSETLVLASGAPIIKDLSYEDVSFKLQHA